MSQRGRFKFYITGSSGQLAFSDYATYLTSSSPLTNGVWQHVAVVVGGGSASFYVNVQSAGSPAYTGTLPAFSSSTVSGGLVIGAEMSLNGSVVAANRGYSGFIFETKAVSQNLSTSALSQSWNSSLTGSASGSSNILHYSRFNDGPLGYAHGFSQGSGVFDYGQSGQSGIHGQFVNVDSVLPVYPIWQLNDNVMFYAPKTVVTSSAPFMKVFHIPSMFYGRQVATGSIQLICNNYNSAGIVRVLNDDGRGGLYISGSMTKTISGEDYRGVVWNKAGNIFYSEGLAVITDPTLFDFGEGGLDWSGSPDLLQVSFRGQTRMIAQTLVCRLGQAEANASNNPTFSRQVGGSNLTYPQYQVKYLDESGGSVTYITAIGMYDENRELVAVVKLAQPIRKREKDKLMFRVRLDW